MTSNSTETDFFDGVGGGSGAPGALLKNMGDFVHGQIVDMYKRDYVPYGKTDPEKREDGTPKQQLVIIVQTENRNWANVSKIPVVDHTVPNSPAKDPSEDDGRRAVYVPEGKNIQFAIGRAAQAVGAKPAVGGTLGVKIVNLKDTGKGNPLKEHEAVYQPPSASDAFFNQAPSAPPAQAAPQQQAPAPQAPQQAAPQQQAPAPQAPPAQPAAPAQQDPWATQPAQSAPAQQPAPSQDPWATSPAPQSGGTSGPPF